MHTIIVISWDIEDGLVNEFCTGAGCYNIVHIGMDPTLCFELPNINFAETMRDITLGFGLIKGFVGYFKYSISKN